MLLLTLEQCCSESQRYNTLGSQAERHHPCGSLGLRPSPEALWDQEPFFISQ